jgi:thiopeptide-type bacteriocin biosynthesis protein
MITAKDFYLVRTPLLPLQFLDQFNDIPLAELNSRVKEIFTHPYLLEAIYIASPELYQELQKWQQGLITGEKEVNKLVAALFRYILRMCTRCTPYGLFAGCATGAVTGATGVELAPIEQHKKHCRLDMNYVAELADMIARQPEIQQQLTFVPNNSLYRAGNAYRYASFTVKNKFRHYDLTSVTCTDYLDAVLATAQNGATIAQLTNCIVSDDITEAEAREFIHELIDSQLLVSELEPTVTGEEFFNRLIHRLAALQNTAAITTTLQNIRQLLQLPGTSIDKYLQTHALVKQLLPDTNSKDLVQTDLFLATRHNTLSHTVINNIQREIIPLWKLAQRNNNPDLQQFAHAFRERYEEQEIPLNIALDAEAGIGYAGHTGGQADHTPLVDDIFVQKGAGGNNTISWGKLQEFQLKQLHNCLRNHQTEIILTDKDLDDLKETDTPDLPHSMYLMGTLLGKSAAAIDAGDYLFELSTCHGPSAGNLLGRFCHGDAVLTEKVKACLQEEAAQHPDFVYAEVIHLPEARAGNILLRPQLRDYEIVYLGNGSVPQSHQLPLTDLMVSVQQNTIVLRSKKLNKRVIPRLSTAHNYRAAGLPAYKFLCDLQFQQLHTGLHWSWDHLAREPFLPRVRYGKIILSKCTWLLHKKDYPQLADKHRQADYTALFGKIRAQWRLPRYVVIAEGDNELFIDMDNAACIQLLATTLIKKEQVKLQEFLSTADLSWVTGAQGNYTNEVIIPLERTAAKAQPVVPAPATQATAKPLPVRRFITGSEWLYVKIYCGTSSAERILKTIIRPLTAELLAAGTIDQWFFLRYSDPEHHIRVRFHHGTNKHFWKTVLEKLYTAVQPETAGGAVHKLQTDTYEREIERYGAATMELSETLFYYDSQAVVDCIDLLEGEEGESYRWLLAARGVDMLLQDAGYNLPAKAALLKRMQQSFFQEFGGDKALQTQLNDKHREHMRQLGSFLQPAQDAENGIEEVIAIFTLRSMRSTAALQNAAAPVHEQLSSYIHMFLNRMLLSNQRKHELVIYHFLSRYYESQLAIQKKQQQQVHSGHGLSNI